MLVLHGLAHLLIFILKFEGVNIKYFILELFQLCQGQVAIRGHELLINVNDLVTIVKNSFTIDRI